MVPRRETNITIFLNSLDQVLLEFNIASIVIAIKKPINPPTKTETNRFPNINIYPFPTGIKQPKRIKKTDLHIVKPYTSLQRFKRLIKNSN
jgi:hypothetical protein